jgi:hypothetical protein
MPLALGTTAGRSLRGTVRVPGDKSISHRALLFGAIAEGTTRIEGLLPAEDPLSTAACLRAMGVAVSPIEAGQPVLVEGVGLDGFQEPEDVLDCGNSGTTMRLMLGLLAGRSGRHFVLNGDASLRRRPMQPLIQALRQLGADIRCPGEEGFFPLEIRARGLAGREGQRAGRVGRIRKRGRDPDERGFRVARPVTLVHLGLGLIGLADARAAPHERDAVGLQCEVRELRPLHFGCHLTSPRRESRLLFAARFRRNRLVRHFAGDPVLPHPALGAVVP